MTDTTTNHLTRSTLMARWLVASLQAGAQTAPKFPDAQASDSVAMGWMVGSPPPAFHALAKHLMAKPQ